MSHPRGSRVDQVEQFLMGLARGVPHGITLRYAAAKAAEVAVLCSDLGGNVAAPPTPEDIEHHLAMAAQRLEQSGALEVHDPVCCSGRCCRARYRLPRRGPPIRIREPGPARAGIADPDIAL